MSAKNPNSHNSVPNSEYSKDDKFKLGKFAEFLTPEIKAMLAKYADPLTLNYKLLMNYDKPYGLFADEKHVDSALAYLKRIGQDSRYEMLKIWLENFHFLLTDFEFLMLAVEGLNEIQNINPSHVFTEENKLNFVIRETADIFVQSLLTNYRQIWFDDIRRVEVLPINLRRFDINVLVYSSGYYNMLFYDKPTEVEVGPQQEENPQHKIFPTLRKLSYLDGSEKSMSEFNYVLYTLGDCSINNEESGKEFAATISNEQNSDFIKNNITLNYRFANYTGLFNNISGEANFGTLLALSAAQEQGSKVAEEINKSLKEKLKNAGKTLKEGTVKTLNTKLDNIKKTLRSNNSVIGDLASKMTIEHATKMVKNTIDLGINSVYDKAINDPFTKLNNLVYRNFGNNIYDSIKNNSNNVKKNVSLITNETQNNIYNTEGKIANIQTNADKGVKFGVSNIYTGGNL